jgi:hypothetical protein
MPTTGEGGGSSRQNLGKHALSVVVWVLHGFCALEKLRSSDQWAEPMWEICIIMVCEMGVVGS